MEQKIRIIRGRYGGKNTISNSIFTLRKSLVIDNGKVTATVNASDLLGPKYSTLVVEVEDYKLID